MLFSIFQAMGSQNGMAVVLTTFLLRVPAVLLALSLHEASHGFVAYKLGDPTARNLGRITINPIKHLDPIGTISMLLFGIGWAKPVPVNSRYFKKPKRDMAFTAAAGPLSNLLQGIIAVILLMLTTKLLLTNSELSFAYSYYKYATGSVFLGLYNLYFYVIFNFSVGLKVAALLIYLLFIYASLNFTLALFNLIPIPPFDGSRILFVFLPDKYYFAVMKYERFIMIGFLALFFVGGHFGLFDSIFSWFVDIFFNAFSWIL